MQGHRVFTPEVSAQLRRIELTTHGLVESLYSGEYHSIFKGRGLEFSDVREYQPGDDVRAIDWNVTARRGRLFVKEYVEERQLNVLVIVDVSASKSFGTGVADNRAVAAEIAAIIALAATAHNDRAGLLLVSEDVEHYIAPDTGRRHALRLVLDLLAHRAEGRRTRLSSGLAFADRVLRQRSTVFLVSDFVTSTSADSGLEHSARKLAWDHDFVPIRITDPRGLELPNVGLIAVHDPETGTRKVIQSSRRSEREAFRARAERRRAAIDGLFREIGVDSIELDPTGDYLPSLIAYFRRQARLRR